MNENTDELVFVPLGGTRRDRHEHGSLRLRAGVAPRNGSWSIAASRFAGPESGGYRGHRARYELHREDARRPRWHLHHPCPRGPHRCRRHACGRGCARRSTPRASLPACSRASASRSVARPNCRCTSWRRVRPWTSRRSRSSSSPSRTRSQRAARWRSARRPARWSIPATGRSMPRPASATPPTPPASTAIGEEGVLALVCDSTNILRDGVSPSEVGSRGGADRNHRQGEGQGARHHLRL